MVARGVVSAVRYRWNHHGGVWAATRVRAAGWPGRTQVRTVTTAPELSIAYSGYPEGLRYVLPYLYEQQAAMGGGPVTVTDTGPARWRRPRGGSGADIELVGCDSGHAAALPDERSVVLPFRVHLLLDVVPDVEEMLKRVSRNERRQFANLRRQHDWAWQVGTEVSDLEFFYQRMHLPTMDSRHGEHSRSTDWDIALNCLFRKGHLFFVTEGGRRVAGVLCRHDEASGLLTMRLLGVLDGDETYYRSGAVKAVYYLATEWAATNGVRRIDMSGGEPFPGKGVFQFKRRFHPTAVLATDHFRDRRLWLHVNRDTPAVRDLLVATPMFTVKPDGTLHGVHFLDRDRPARTRIRTDGPGIASAVEIDLDAFLGGVDRRRGTEEAA